MTCAFDWHICLWPWLLQTVSGQGRAYFNWKCHDDAWVQISLPLLLLNYIVLDPLLKSKNMYILPLVILTVYRCNVKKMSRNKTGDYNNIICNSLLHKPLKSCILAESLSLHSPSRTPLSQPPPLFRCQTGERPHLAFPSHPTTPLPSTCPPTRDNCRRFTSNDDHGFC